MRGAAILGSGRVAQAAARSLSGSPRLNLVAAHSASPERAGLDLGELAGIGPSGVLLDDSLASVLDSDEVDVLIHCGAEHGDDLFELLLSVADSGKALVTVSGLVHAPTELGPGRFEELQTRALAGGARMTGAGMNPGFALDVLPVLASSLLAGPTSIRSRRVTDIRHWGDAALSDQAGVGGEPGSGRGGGGFTLLPSGALVAEALKGTTAGIEEETVELVTDRARGDGGRSIEAGRVSGFEKRVTGEVDGLRLELVWTALFCIDPAADGVEPGISLEAAADLDLVLDLRGPAIDDSYPATAARAVSAAAALVEMKPGIHRPDQVPAT